MSNLPSSRNTGVIFNAETGLSAPQTADVREIISNEWQQAFYEPDSPLLDTEPSTPAGQLIDGEVAEIESKNGQFLYLANQFNPKVAVGRWQDALGYIYFQSRKIDEPTVVTCQVTGSRGTVVPYGAVVSNTDGYELICNTVGGINLGDTGTGEGTFRVSQTGPIDIPAHSVNNIVTVIPGWDTIDNEAAGATGRDIESRAEFETRRYNSVAANSHGSVGAIYGTLADLQDVIDVQVLENIGPDPVIKYGVTVPGHGITVCIYGGDEQDIARVIYEKKDAGADTGGNTQITYLRPDYHNATYVYFIERPETVNFWVKVVLGAENLLTTDTTARIQNAVLEDFLGNNRASGNSRVGLASRVYSSRFFDSVYAVEGIRNVKSISIALGDTVTDDDYFDRLTINGNQEPVMTVENITVESEEE